MRKQHEWTCRRNGLPQNSFSILGCLPASEFCPAGVRVSALDGSGSGENGEFTFPRQQLGLEGLDWEERRQRTRRLGRANEKMLTC